jgi:serine/threonine protein phosphatase 1
MQWIIGDIHGCFYTLESLIKRVKQADMESQFVFVGDYIDRGKHNKEVVDLVIELQKQGAVCLRGNHDDVFSYILGNETETNILDFAYDKTWQSILSWWSMNGFLPTAESYGVKGNIFSHQPGEVIDTIRATAGDEHKKFFKDLPMVWENDTHFAVHAYLPPDWQGPKYYMTMDQKTEMLWNRFPRTIDSTLKSFDIQWSKIGVVGHTPVVSYSSAAPIKYKQLRLIDCGVFRGEYLCAYCADVDDFILEATDQRDLS